MQFKPSQHTQWQECKDAATSNLAMGVSEWSRDDINTYKNLLAASYKIGPESVSCRYEQHEFEDHPHYGKTIKLIFSVNYIHKAVHPTTGEIYEKYVTKDAYTAEVPIPEHVLAKFKAITHS